MTLRDSMRATLRAIAHHTPHGRMRSTTRARVSRAPTAVLLLCVAAGCRNGAPRTRFAPRPSAEQTMPDGDSVRISTSVCPLEPLRAPTASRRTAALLIRAKLEPAPKSGAMAVVRLTGETTARSSVSIDPTQLARFELSPGGYDVQITMDNYATVNTHVALTLGCTLQITPALHGGSLRR